MTSCALIRAQFATSTQSIAPAVLNVCANAPLALARSGCDDVQRRARKHNRSDIHVGCGGENVVSVCEVMTFGDTASANFGSDSRAAARPKPSHPAAHFNWKLCPLPSSLSLYL
jgi:hypothetical protein